LNTVNKHSIRLTKELVSSILLHPEIQGQTDMVLEVCENLKVAFNVLKYQGDNFCLEEIVTVAFAYTEAKGKGIF
jgi:hypothetical protein